MTKTDAMRPLRVGEWAESFWVQSSFGFSFLEVTGERRTYWVIRDKNGEFVDFAVFEVDPIL